MLWQQLYRRVTLRQWLALWAGSLILVCSVVLIVIVNVAASLNFGAATVYEAEDSSSQTAWQQGEPTATPMAASDAAVYAGGPPGASAYTLVPRTSVSQLRLISIAALLLVAPAGIAGTYWLARFALRPVRELCEAASRIGPRTLSTRLSLEGPRDEVRELADAFDAMLQRLENAFTQQGRFVSDAAHELRTPLSTLRTTLEVTAADPQTTLDDYRRMASTFEQMFTRLERLVGDLLILASADRPLTFEPVSLEPVLEQTLEDLAPVAAGRQVTLAWQRNADLLVLGHESLLGRAFGNLIENGIRYNRPGGEVRVSVAGDGDWAVVEVSDTGIGIAPEEQARIFERFYRVDRSRTRHKGGAGLGLSIVSLVVQRHGGSVGVESVLGQGSIFTIRLPIASAQ